MFTPASRYRKVETSKGEITMTAAEVLAKHETKRAAEVVELAAAAGLELAAAATLLEKESSGGDNVFGHDPVETGGNYEKGGKVTKEAYLKYKAHRDQFGAQGVGPTQLTFPPFQDRADARGGCFDFRVNCSVGFKILADLIKANGVHDGFRIYNGGPKPSDAAESYANDAVKKLAVWRSRLAGTEEDDMPDEKTFKNWVREVVNEELDKRLKGGVIPGQPNVGGTLAVIADHVDRVLKEVRQQ
jgi:hypothetical protein